MFVRSDVIGVRSSCDASATSWRWAAIEPSSVSSIALKCCASSPTSSWVVTSIRRPRSSVAAMWRAASVTATIGATTLRETSRPSATASAMPPRQTSSRIMRRRASTRSVESSERPTCNATPCPTGVVSTRTWTPWTSASEKYRSRAPAATARVRASTGSAASSLPSVRKRPFSPATWMYGVGPPRRADSVPTRGLRKPNPGPGAGSSACAVSAWSTCEISSPRTARYATTQASATATATATAATTVRRRRRGISRAGRSRRRARCAAGAARRPAPSCGAGSPCRRRASSSSSRSRSPTRARRSASA